MKCPNVQAAFHEKWVSGKTRIILIRLYEEHLLMSLHPRVVLVQWFSKVY